MDNNKIEKKLTKEVLCFFVCFWFFLFLNVGIAFFLILSLKGNVLPILFGALGGSVLASGLFYIPIRAMSLLLFKEALNVFMNAQQFEEKHKNIFIRYATRHILPQTKFAQKEMLEYYKD